MRGVEAALLVLRDVGKGELASIALRKYAPDLPQTDMTLAASLVYCTLRKRLLWYEMLRSFLKPAIEGLNEETVNAMLLGAAGMTELRHFAPMVLANALVQSVKDNVGEREARVVNAVLHRVGSTERVRRQERRGFREAGLDVFARLERNLEDRPALLRVRRERVEENASRVHMPDKRAAETCVERVVVADLLHAVAAD